MVKILFALLLVILVLGCTFGVNVWVMICGWGVSPASWGVIIGGWLISLFLLVVLEFAKMMFKDD
jgi:hypothetical protein